MRFLPLIAAPALLTAGTARARNDAAPPRATGQADDAVNPIGNAPSSGGASGTIREAPTSDFAEGANSFTEGQTRIAGAGFLDVSPLEKGEDGFWRSHARREGRTFGVGFDDKSQVAFQ